MTSNDTAQFISDRALTLDYEARQHPRTAKMAAQWLIRAAEWARTHGHRDLCVTLVCQSARLQVFSLLPSLFPRKRATRAGRKSAT